eukprot:Skav203670  [mRNA]  locus=scaffold3418:124013:124945:+ [translate_table: standard]
MASDLDPDRGQYAGQVPEEIESWTRAVVHIEGARSQIPLQKLAVVQLPSIAELRKSSRRAITSAGSVGGDARIVPPVYPAVYDRAQNVAYGIAPGRSAVSMLNRGANLQVGVNGIPPEDAGVLAYAMLSNNLLASSDLAGIALRSGEVRENNDSLIYYHPTLEDEEKEQAADDALESLKALGPIGMVGVEYLRTVGVEFERPAAGGALAVVTDQTIYGGGGGAGAAGAAAAGPAQQAAGQAGAPGLAGQGAPGAAGNHLDSVPADLTIRRAGAQPLRGDPLSRVRRDLDRLLDILNWTSCRELISDEAEM